MLHQLAIDAGGTSTRAMLLRPDGQCLGVGRGGRGNPVSDGVESAAGAIGTAVSHALTAAGPDGSPSDVGAITLAMAGGSVVAVEDWLGPALAARGVTARISVEPDLLAMFCSGTAAPDGYGLVAGTGATAVRVRGGEMDTTADGLGWLLGDTGSGFWIGQRIARAVAADLDGHGPATTLTPRLLDRLEILPAEERIGFRPAVLKRLISAVYLASPLRLATVAPLAFDDLGDEVAARIVDEAIASLARTVLDVADPALPGPLVLGGGVASQPLVRDGIVAAVAAAGITGPVLAVDDGLVGAGVLALRRAGVDLDAVVFDRLRTSTTQARARTTA